MNVQQLLLPLIEQLDALAHTVNESPYISREGRLAISKEIDALSHRLREGELSYVQGESSLENLNKKAATDEVMSLASKIRQLNPTSPRLEILRNITEQLYSKEISPVQARKKLQELMQA